MFRNFEWDAKKASILEKYTVKDQIQVSFMQETTESKVWTFTSLSLFCFCFLLNDNFFSFFVSCQIFRQKRKTLWRIVWMNWISMKRIQKIRFHSK